MQCFLYTYFDASTTIEIEAFVTPRNAILPLCSPTPTLSPEASDLLAL